MAVMIDRQTALYRTVWRWHFYAGLFVMPFILILSVTGALYLFKPQIERWEERRFQALPITHIVPASTQRNAALAAFKGARFDSYRLPERIGDAAMIRLILKDGHMTRDVFVSPQGRVLGSLDPEMRLMALDSKIHGSLLAGRVGGWLVELAASWAIVLVLTGLYLWWPGRRLIWPRTKAVKQIFWRDLHSVIGVWVSGLALVLLVTGMPWTSVWGDTFKMVRTELGLVQGKQDWTIGTVHIEHDHGMRMKADAATTTISLDDIVAKAKAEKLTFPVLVKPPGGRSVWTVKSDAQNRPLRVTIIYDSMTGKVLSREAFADRHLIDRAVGYGIAWHEGQLFGWINQLIGVITATALVILVISGFVMWRRRKPNGKGGAPQKPAVSGHTNGAITILALLALILPMLTASLMILWCFEKFILPYTPRLSAWLGYD
jgi:uncharacterized iron-regulated membrane protein